MRSCLLLAVLAAPVMAGQPIAPPAGSVPRLVERTGPDGARVRAWEWVKPGEPVGESDAARLERIRATGCLMAYPDGRRAWVTLGAWVDAGGDPWKIARGYALSDDDLDFLRRHYGMRRAAGCPKCGPKCDCKDCDCDARSWRGDCGAAPRRAPAAPPPVYYYAPPPPVCLPGGR